MDVQVAAVSTQEFDHRKSDWVGAAWGAGCENTVGTIVGGWCSHQLEPVFLGQPIEKPEHNQMRKTLDVGEGWLKLRQDLKNALGIVLRTQTFWNFLRALIRTVYVPIGWKENIVWPPREILAQLFVSYL